MPSISGKAPLLVAVNVAPTPLVPLLYVAVRFAVVAISTAGLETIPCATSSTYDLFAASLGFVGVSRFETRLNDTLAFDATLCPILITPLE